jgi:hypothetical protein
LRSAASSFSAAVVDTPRADLNRGLKVRDPDGHAVQVTERLVKD